MRSAKGLHIDGSYHRAIAHRCVAPSTCLDVIKQALSPALDATAHYLSSCCIAGEEASSQCSLAYAAPEVLQSCAAGMRIPAQPAADIWALGVTVYEALTGTLVFPPFLMKPADIHAAASGSAHYPWEVDHDVQFSRYRIRPVVEACLARDAAARPSAAQLLAQLDRLVNVTGAAQSHHTTSLCAELDSTSAATPAPEN